jgi:hypothetical protein
LFFTGLKSVFNGKRKVPEIQSEKLVEREFKIGLIVNPDNKRVGFQPVFESGIPVYTQQRGKFTAWEIVFPRTKYLIAVVEIETCVSTKTIQDVEILTQFNKGTFVHLP